MTFRMLIAATLAATLFHAQPAKADLLSVAQRYVGLSEVKHRKQLRGLLGVDPRRVPWCGAFMAAVTKKAGRKPPRSPNIAISWRNFGKAVSLRSVRPGDVVVVRSVRMHVGVFKRKAGQKICLISGNSRNAIREACYRQSQVRAVRR